MNELDYKMIIACIYFGFAIIEIARGCFLFTRQTKRKDVILDIASASVLPLVIVPVIFWGAPTIIDNLYPGNAGVWADLPWYTMLAILLVADDMTQYWWHRLSHSNDLFYGFHRAHHSAEYMSVRIVYRNNFFYYAAMPGIWFSGALIHLGFGPVYAGYAIIKMTVIIAAHSSVAWDKPLYEIRILQPVMWVLERLISTPSTHSAHHGLQANDPHTHYRGNYGNLLFFWDVLFGTARITRGRPAGYGIENMVSKTWWQELLWPFGNNTVLQQKDQPITNGFKFPQKAESEVSLPR